MASLYWISPQAVIIMPADGLALFSARPSAGIMMTKSLCPVWCLRCDDGSSSPRCWAVSYMHPTPQQWCYQCTPHWALIPHIYYYTSTPVYYGVLTVLNASFVEYSWACTPSSPRLPLYWNACLSASSPKPHTDPSSWHLYPRKRVKRWHPNL